MNREERIALFTGDLTALLRADDARVIFNEPIDQ